MDFLQHFKAHVTSAQVNQLNNVSSPEVSLVFPLPSLLTA